MKKRNSSKIRFPVKSKGMHNNVYSKDNDVDRDRIVYLDGIVIDLFPFKEEK